MAIEVGKIYQSVTGIIDRRVDRIEDGIVYYTIIPNERGVALAKSFGFPNAERVLSPSYTPPTGCGTLDQFQAQQDEINARLTLNGSPAFRA